MENGDFLGIDGTDPTILRMDCAIVGNAIYVIIFMNYGT